MARTPTSSSTTNYASLAKASVEPEDLATRTDVKAVPRQNTISAPESNPRADARTSSFGVKADTSADFVSAAPTGLRPTTASNLQTAGKHSRPTNEVPIDKQGDVRLGNPKVYDSVGSAGSGFVNLSHLLGLNKGSGGQSAKDLARRMNEKGGAALGGIGAMEGQFNQAAKAGTTSFTDYNPNDFSATGERKLNPVNPFDTNQPQEASTSPTAQSLLDKANAGYKGPNDLASMGGYADLAKKVGDANDMAKNLQNGGVGLAAQVGKEKGLSQTQNAASAFYMGVNNPNIKRASSAFTGLQAALDKANSRALGTAQMSRKYTADSAGKLGQVVADQDKARQDLELQNWAKDQVTGAQNIANDPTDTRGRAELAKSRGVPSWLADQGVSEPQWAAAGYPKTLEEWNASQGK